MAKRPRKRTAAKIATKREQGELVTLAKRLTAEPAILVPATNGRRPGKIERLDRRLHRIAKRADKPGRLRWALRFGDPLARAYANLLLVGHAGKAERMASMHTPVGDLKYAVRGNIPKRHLVAVQHFRHPEVRILGYRELAQTVNGVIWATPDGTAYTAHGEAPPDAWFDLVLPQLPVAFTRTGSELRCPHFEGVADPRDPRAPAGLALKLAAGPTTILVCRACTGEFRKKPLLGTLATYLIGLRPERDIHIEPTGTPRTCVHTGDCAWVRHLPDIHPKTLERYRAGGLPEAELLDKLEPNWVEAVRAAGEPLYVAGDECHGADREGLLTAIGATGEMREAVTAFLERGPPVLLATERSLNKVLEARWDEAPQVLAALHPDQDALAELVARHRQSPPAVILQEVLEARRAAAAMAGFPRYRELPAPAAVADRLARGHRIGAGPGLVDAVDRELKRASHKGLLWAALRIAGATQGREWQFNKHDQEAGEFLEAPLRDLLDADAGTYHQALGQVHTLAGGAGGVPAPSGKHGA